MHPLTAAETASHLKTRPDWKIEGGELVRMFKFETFRDAVAFVNRVADLAEEANHGAVTGEGERHSAGAGDA